MMKNISFEGRITGMYCRSMMTCNLSHLQMDIEMGKKIRIPLEKQIELLMADLLRCIIQSKSVGYFLQ